jgi:DNA invertase Pin-like site-specific DNA recombinase
MHRARNRQRDTSCSTDKPNPLWGYAKPYGARLVSYLNAIGMAMPAHQGKFVAYFRVSTDKQGKSGLGLEAQREAVLAYLDGGRWSLVQEFVEVESGKRDDRPELAAALAACKKNKAKLIIAKLDRLSRNLAFIATLMDSGVEFIAVDNPHANKLTVHILAVVAQHEREMIGQRTRDALQAAKGAGQETRQPKARRGSQARRSRQQVVGGTLCGERPSGDPRNPGQRGQIAPGRCAGAGRAWYCDGARWRMDAGADKRNPPPGG